MVEVFSSKQNEKYCDRFLDHFFELFKRKLKLHIFHLSRFALVPCAVYLVKVVSVYFDSKKVDLRVGILKASGFCTILLVLRRKYCSLVSPEASICPTELISEYVGHLGSLPSWLKFQIDISTLTPPNRSECNSAESEIGSNPLLFIQ